MTESMMNTIARIDGVCVFPSVRSEGTPISQTPKAVQKSRDELNLDYRSVPGS